MKGITEYVEKLVYKAEIDLHEQDDDKLYDADDERIGFTEEINDTYSQIPSVEIITLQAVLQDALDSGATRVHIYPHTDHKAYEIHGVKLIIEKT